MYITNLQTGKRYACRAEQSLMEILCQNGFFLAAPCGGKGRCGNCKILLSPVDTPITARDRACLTAEELSTGYRLACTFLVTENIGFYPPQQDTGSVHILHKTNSESLQVAIDIGTTTIEMALIDSKGQKLAALSELNHQRSYGADVISRIQYTAEHPDGLNRLHQILVAQLNGMIHQIAATYGCKKECIRKAVIVANTTLVHLLLQHNPRSLAVYPFTPQVKEAQILTSEESPLTVEEVCILPCVSAYIGADITALMCCFDLLHTKENVLVADIGTNGEMVLASNGRLFACSTAAGPAFEGANVSCGIGGVPGGICRVRLADNHLQFETIDNWKAVGLCGSGAVDFLAILLELGIINKAGAIAEFSELTSVTAMKIYRQTLRETKGEKRLYLTENIWLSEHDIRQFQLAKAAIWSGLQLLIQTAALAKPDRFIVTGGLGTHLNPDSALRIGLFPAEWKEIIETVQSGALEGAIRCVDTAVFEKTKDYERHCQYIELATHPDFSDLFMKNMFF